MAGVAAFVMARFTALRLRDSTRRARSLAAMFILVLQLLLKVSGWLFQPLTIMPFPTRQGTCLFGEQRHMPMNHW